MNKEEFVIELRNRLQGLPKSDIEERIDFYVEIIDDKVEEGKTEEEAIDELGGVDGVVNQISKDTPISSLVKERMMPKRKLEAFEIILIVLGFPLWFPLLTVALVLIFVAFILVWVLVLVTYVVEISFIGSSGLCLVGFGAALGDGTFNSGYLALAITMIGISLLFFIPCYYVTRGTFKVTTNILLSIKRKLIGGKKNEKNN